MGKCRFFCQAPCSGACHMLYVHFTLDRPKLPLQIPYTCLSTLLPHVILLKNTGSGWREANAANTCPGGRFQWGSSPALKIFKPVNEAGRRSKIKSLGKERSILSSIEFEVQPQVIHPIYAKRGKKYIIDICHSN
jgi:hypothetical protein